MRGVMTTARILSKAHKSNKKGGGIFPAPLWKTLNYLILRIKVLLKRCNRKGLQRG